MTYGFICFYLLCTAFCFYVFMLGKEIEQSLLTFIYRKTGIDLELQAFAGNGMTSVAAKAAIAGIRSFIFLHGIFAALLVAGVVVELIK